MLQYLWPLALVVLSNTVYQLAAKSIPEKINTFASLTVIYLVGAVFSLLLFFLTAKETSLFAEYRKLNWAPFLLGLSLVGLEAGFIHMYKAGWTIGTAQIVQAAVLTIILFIIGILFFKEAFTWKKLAGIALCLGGLALMNL